MNIDIGNGDAIANFNNSQMENLIVQIVTDESFNGTTTKVEIQESLDGVNWQTIENKSGDVLEVVIDAAGSSFMLKTDIAFSDTIRANITAGDATSGILTVKNNYKA